MPFQFICREAYLLFLCEGLCRFWQQRQQRRLDGNINHVNAAATNHIPLAILRAPIPPVAPIQNIRNFSGGSGSRSSGNAAGGASTNSTTGRPSTPRSYEAAGFM